jgi:beta-mannanase
VQYPWGTERRGNDPELFKQAFKHVSSLFKSSGANARMQICYNCDNPDGNDTPFSDWYPGEWRCH